MYDGLLGLYVDSEGVKVVPPTFHVKKDMIMSHTAKSPLDQFEIRDLIGLNAPVLGYLRIFVTNIGLYLTTATVIALAFSFLATNKDKIVANN